MVFFCRPRAHQPQLHSRLVSWRFHQFTSLIAVEQSLVVLQSSQYLHLRLVLAAGPVYVVREEACGHHSVDERQRTSHGEHIVDVVVVALVLCRLYRCFRHRFGLPLSRLPIIGLNFRPCCLLAVNHHDAVAYVGGFLVTLQHAVALKLRSQKHYDEARCQRVVVCRIRLLGFLKQLQRLFILSPLDESVGLAAHNHAVGLVVLALLRIQVAGSHEEDYNQ